LLTLYGFRIRDVFNGRALLSECMLYIQRLPYEPKSLWRAMQLGGPEHLGWSAETYKLADLIDAVQINTVITANVGSKKAPEMPEPVYRPSVKEDHDEEIEIPKQSLEEFDISKLMPMEG